MKEQPTYYSILTADVRYDFNLTDSEKLLYSEITALSNKYGYCTATNNYFAKLYDVTKVTISRRISNLKKHGYLDIEMILEDNEVKQRKIYPLSQKLRGINTNDNTPINNSDNTPINNSDNTPINRNDKDNNTSNNNTSINTTSKNKGVLGDVIDKRANKDYSEIISEYNKLAFGLPTQRTYEQIEDWLKLHNKKLIIHVMQYAHDLGKHNISYVNGILRNARQRKIETVEDFEAENNRFNSNQTNQQYNNAYANSLEARTARRQAKEKIERDRQNLKTVVDPNAELPF